MAAWRLPSLLIVQPAAAELAVLRRLRQSSPTAPSRTALLGDPKVGARPQARSNGDPSVRTRPRPNAISRLRMAILRGDIRHHRIVIVRDEVLDDLAAGGHPYIRMSGDVFERFFERIRKVETSEDMLAAGIMEGTGRTWNDPAKSNVDAFTSIDRKRASSGDTIESTS